jgi:hypothetical protein
VSPYEYILNHVNVKLAPSKIHGVGVFAIRDIEENEDLFVNWNEESGTYYITEDELNSLPDEVKFHLQQIFLFKKIDEKWLFQIILNKGCHWIFKTPHHWVNSCSQNENPNVDLNTLKSLKKIRCGEEILTKYGKYEKFKSNRTTQII